MKPIYEKIEYLEVRLYSVIITDPRVVEVELEDEDDVADYDFIVSFKNTNDVKKEINDLAKKIERRINCIKVKLLDEQIEDVILDNEEIISVDFYCTIKL